MDNFIRVENRSPRAGKIYMMVTWRRRFGNRKEWTTTMLFNLSHQEGQLHRGRSNIVRNILAERVRKPEASKMGEKKQTKRCLDSCQCLVAEKEEAKMRKRNSYTFLRQNSERWTDPGEPHSTHRDCARRQMFWEEIIEYFMEGWAFCLPFFNMTCGESSFLGMVLPSWGVFPYLGGWPAQLD